MPFFFFFIQSKREVFWGHAPSDQTRQLPTARESFTPGKTREGVIPQRTSKEVADRVGKPRGPEGWEDKGSPQDKGCGIPLWTGIQNSHGGKLSSLYWSWHAWVPL